MPWLMATLVKFGFIRMSYRFMRVLVFFDLPVDTSYDRREYARFRKFLIKSGFMMMQESIYCKLALNLSAVEAIASNIRKNKPPAGLVQMMSITEKQYSNIEFVIGECKSDVVDSDEKVVVI